MKKVENLHPGWAKHKKTESANKEQAADTQALKDSGRIS